MSTRTFNEILIKITKNFVKITEDFGFTDWIDDEGNFARDYSDGTVGLFFNGNYFKKDLNGSVKIIQNLE